MAEPPAGGDRGLRSGQGALPAALAWGTDRRPRPAPSAGWPCACGGCAVTPPCLAELQKLEGGGGPVRAPPHGSRPRLRQERAAHQPHGGLAAGTAFRGCSVLRFVATGQAGAATLPDSENSLKTEFPSSGSPDPEASPDVRRPLPSPLCPRSVGRTRPQHPASPRRCGAALRSQGAGPEGPGGRAWGRGLREGHMPPGGGAPSPAWHQLFSRGTVRKPALCTRGSGSDSEEQGSDSEEQLPRAQVLPLPPWEGPGQWGCPDEPAPSARAHGDEWAGGALPPHPCSSCPRGLFPGVPELVPPQPRPHCRAARPPRPRPQGSLLPLVQGAAAGQSSLVQRGRPAALLPPAH